MRWCEENRIDYILGLAQNSRLRAAQIQARWPEVRIIVRGGDDALEFLDRVLAGSDVGRVEGAAEEKLAAEDVQR